MQENTSFLFFLLLSFSKKKVTKENFLPPVFDPVKAEIWHALGQNRFSKELFCYASRFMPDFPDRASLNRIKGRRVLARKGPRELRLK